MYKHYIHIFNTTASLFLAVFAFSQTKALQEVDSLVTNTEIEKAFIGLDKIDTTRLKLPDKARYYYLNAKTLTLDNQEEKAYPVFLKAKTYYVALDSLDMVADINLNIVQIINASEFEALDYQSYLDEYVAYARKKNDPEILAEAYMQIGKCLIRNEPKSGHNYFQKALRENLKTTDTLQNARIHHNIAVYYADYTPLSDSALYHYDLALLEYQKIKHIDYIFYVYRNKAVIYKNRGNYKKAIDYYLKSDSLPFKEYRKNNKRLLYELLSGVYKENQDYANALKYLELYKVYDDSIREDIQNIKILDIQTKYETEKKTSDNLKLKQRQLWLVAVLGIVAALLIISSLAYRNQRVKRKIAVIEARKKERDEISRKLHDDLASLLLHLEGYFKNLTIMIQRQHKVENEFLGDVGNLIGKIREEARKIGRDKVRDSSKDKGFLPRIKKYISDTNKAHGAIFTIKDRGMDKQLKADMEDAIYTIIKNLVNNVSKHANATEAVIHLRHHGGRIVISVEDNGDGFDPENVDSEKSTGLRRVKENTSRMGGKIKIASVIGERTKITIKIPVK